MGLGGRHPVIVTQRDTEMMVIIFGCQGPLIFLLYHYYRVGDPPRVHKGFQACTLRLYAGFWYHFKGL